MGSGQTCMLNLMPCTIWVVPICCEDFSIPRVITNRVSVHGRVISVLKVLCSLGKAKAKQNQISITINVSVIHVYEQIGYECVYRLQACPKNHSTPKNVGVPNHYTHQCNRCGKKHIIWLDHLCANQVLGSLDYLGYSASATTSIYCTP